MTAHLLKFFSEINEHLIGMYRAYRVDQAALNFWFLWAFKGSFDGNSQIADIVESIKNSEHTDTMSAGMLYEFLNDIIGVVVVTEKILTAKQHLNRCLEFCLEFVESLPRVFIEETKAGIESCTAPSLKRLVANIVEGLKHWFHLTVAHTSCAERLMTITQDSFHNFYRIRH